MNEFAGVQVSVSIDEPYEGEIDPSWLATVAQTGLKVAEAWGRSDVSVFITDDETVRELNAEYRGLDETTDVLSFSAEHPGHWEGEGDGPGQQSASTDFVLPPDIPQPLGEIIVSWPQAQRQAADHGVSAQHELAHLIVHGALHLIGHDHLESEDTARMQALERQALESLRMTESTQS